MVLQQYYEQKKQKIHEIINPSQSVNNTVRLFNDSVFTNDSLTFPLVLFKYNNVKWNTSSEKEYKADVDFSVFIILEASFQDDYLECFDLAQKIDKAILLHPDRSELRQNQQDIADGVTNVELITNSSLKVREGQYVVEDEYWEKNNFYIWEINYSTTLIEKEYKKRYTMISNEFFDQTDIDGGEREAALRRDLRTLGFDLDDYHQVQYNGKDLLVYKNIDEQLILNATEVELTNNNS